MADLLDPARSARIEVEQIQDVLAPGHAATGQAAGEDLREGREIRCDPVVSLRAAGRYAKTRHHLVKVQQDPACLGDPA